jgi:GNAT superfamily N-acetyltransferase
MKEFHTGISGFSIRFAVKQDAPLILDLIRGLSVYEKMADQVTATVQSLEQSIFERNEAQVLIGEYQGQPVGFALFFQNFSTFVGKANLYLEDLFIYEQYRGKGFGKAMFRALAQIAVDRGYQRFDWVCLDWNVNSIAFYKSLGATALDEWTTYRLTTPEIKALVQGESSR